jgi:hypothetical protein
MTTCEAAADTSGRLHLPHPLAVALRHLAETAQELLDQRAVPRDYPFRQGGKAHAYQQQAISLEDRLMAAIADAHHALAREEKAPS